MPCIGITGGIATGKSSFAAAFLRHLPAEFFDADACAHELLAHDEPIREAVREAFGPDAFRPDGLPDRAFLARLVFSDTAKRTRLEEILHPVIRNRWQTQARTAAAGGGWFCVDIPLLYETGAETHFDRVVVVACSSALQRRRLLEERKLDPALAEQVVASQLDLRTKIAKADHLIWNDSTLSCLDRQASLLAGWLRKHHG